MSVIGITFIISLGVLISILAMAYMEGVQGIRYGGTIRRILDRRLSRAFSGVTHFFDSVADFLKRDVFARMLHVLSYIALTLVRYVEQQLVRVTTFFRSFRKRRTRKDATVATWTIDEERKDG